MDNNYFKIKQINNNTWLIDDYGFDLVYLIEGRDKALLIDSGMGMGDLEKLVKKITEKPVILVNTHGDPDHCGGNYQFAGAYLHPDDSGLLEYSYDREYRISVLEAFFSIYTENPPFPYEDWVEGKKTKMGGDIVPFNIWADSKPSPFIPVRQGYKFELGGRQLEVIGIPGHSRGSIGLIDYDQRFLFTGDSVLAQDIWMFIERCTPLETYLNSLLYLDSIWDRYDLIMPGHGKEPIDKGFLKETIDCARKILDRKCRGELYETFLGNALSCSSGRISIVYNKDKLFE